MRYGIGFFKQHPAFVAPVSAQAVLIESKDTASLQKYPHSKPKSPGICILVALVACLWTFFLAMPQYVFADTPKDLDAYKAAFEEAEATSRAAVREARDTAEEARLKYRAADDLAREQRRAIVNKARAAYKAVVQTIEAAHKIAEPKDEAAYKDAIQKAEAAYKADAQEAEAAYNAAEQKAEAVYDAVKQKTGATIKKAEAIAEKAETAYETALQEARDQREAKKNQERMRQLHEESEQGEAEAQRRLGRAYLRGDGAPQDLQKAIYWYEKAAKQGDEDAQKSLGELYLWGNEVAGDPQKGIYWLEKAAEQGDKEVQLSLGIMYLHSGEVSKDLQKAVYWLEKAAKQGDSYARYHLGRTYIMGRDLPKDLEKSRSYYEQAAQKGYFPARYELGVLYLLGTDFVKDSKKAMELLQDGDYEGTSSWGGGSHLKSEAKFYLGYIYDHGDGVAKDPRKAQNLYVEAALGGHSSAAHAAYYRSAPDINGNTDLAKAYGYLLFLLKLDPDNEEAQHSQILLEYRLLPRHHEEGQAFADRLWEGVSPDRKDVSPDRKDVSPDKKEHSPTYFEKAKAFFSGRGTSVPNADESSFVYPALFVAAPDYNETMAVEDSPEAQKQRFQEKAEQGVAAAQYALGYLYGDSGGDRRGEYSYDLEKSIYWLEKAAQQGYPSASVRLGDMYLEGEGVEEDRAKATIYFEQAAKSGHARAQYILGNLSFVYDNPKTVKQTQHWLEKAAEQGNIEAQNQLGSWNYHGMNEHLPQNYQKAVYYLEKAAKQDNAEAQIFLAVMYRSGEGVSVDTKKAMYWLEQAAKQENAEAQLYLGMMYLNGRGVAKNTQKALHWLELSAAKQKDLFSLLSQYKLARMYITGQDIPRDIEKARQYYEQSAEQGFPRAQYELGVLYHQGKDYINFIKDTQTALPLLENAASEGLEESRLYLACLQDKGDIFTADPERARYLYEYTAWRAYKKTIKFMHSGNGVRNLLGNTYENRSVWRGYENAITKIDSRYGVRDMYGTTYLAKGYGYLTFLLKLDPHDKDYLHEQVLLRHRLLPRHMEEAELFAANLWEGVAPARKGEKESTTTKNYISTLFSAYPELNDTLLEEDSLEAQKKRLVKNAEKGIAEAQYALGYFYDEPDPGCVCATEPRTFPYDRQKSIYWLEKAARQGHVIATARLGDTYQAGKDVAKDVAKARSYYEEAAKQGHAKAQYMLGCFFFDSNSASKDLDKAKHWLQLAAEQGYSDAPYLLGKLYLLSKDKDEMLKAKEWFEKIPKKYDHRFDARRLKQWLEDDSEQDNWATPHLLWTTAWPEPVMIPRPKE